MTYRLGKIFINWSSFERGFGIPELFKEASNLPMCDLCQNFPELIKIGIVIQPTIHEPTGRYINQEVIDREVLIECHGKKWSLNGIQAAQFLSALVSNLRD